VGYEEENYQRDFHDPLSCVEPCNHIASIYRQMWAQTDPALSGSAKTGHTKGPHLTEPPLEYRRDGASTPGNRRATRGTIAARPANRRRLERGKRGVRGIAIRRDDRPRDSTAPVPQSTIKTGQIPSRRHWRTPEAEGAGSWMGCPGQESSRPSLAAPRSLKNRRAAWDL